MEIASEVKLIQNYKQVIKNNSEKDLFFIALPHRIKRLQRNLEIRDSSGNELIYMPYRVVNCLLTRICEEYLEKLVEGLENFENHENKKIIKINKFLKESKNFDFSIIFKYIMDPNENAGDTDETKVPPKFKYIMEFNKNREKHIDTFLKLLQDIEEILPERFKVYARRLYYLVGTSKNFYIPIVKLEKRLKSGSCMLLSYTIESLNRKNIPGLGSQLIGEAWCSIPLEIEPEIENHLKIKSAAKTSLINVEVKKVLSYYNEIANKHKDVSSEYTKRILELRLQNMSRYYDSDMLHTMFSPEESTIIREAIKIYKEKTKKEKITEEEKPRIRTKLSIIRKRNNKSSLNPLSVMTIIMYLILLYPVITLGKCVFESLQKNTQISEILGTVSTSNLAIAISITYALAIAIWYHSFDRNFLDRYTVIHVIIVSILWGIILLPFLFGT